MEREKADDDDNDNYFNAQNTDLKNVVINVIILQQRRAIQSLI